MTFLKTKQNKNKKPQNIVCFMSLIYVCFPSLNIFHNKITVSKPGDRRQLMVKS